MTERARLTKIGWDEDLGQADRAQRMVQAGGLHGRLVLVPTAQ